MLCYTFLIRLLCQHCLQILVLGLVAAVSALPNIIQKREANPSVQSTYGYGQGGTYVLSSQVNCLPGDPCERLPLPARPNGGDPFRSEFRHHAKASKRSVDHSAMTNDGFGHGGTSVPVYLKPF